MLYLIIYIILKKNLIIKNQKLNKYVGKKEFYHQIYQLF